MSSSQRWKGTGRGKRVNSPPREYLGGAGSRRGHAGERGQDTMATTPERETARAIQLVRASGTEASVVEGHDPPGEWPGPPAPTPQEIRDWWEQEQRDRRFYQAD